MSFAANKRSVSGCRAPVNLALSVWRVSEVEETQDPRSAATGTPAKLLPDGLVLAQVVGSGAVQVAQGDFSAEAA